MNRRDVVIKTRNMIVQDLSESSKSYYIERVQIEDGLAWDGERFVEPETLAAETASADAGGDDVAETEQEDTMNRSYTTDTGIRDMVTEALEASQVADDYDIDAITGDLMEAADFDGQAFTNVPEGDEFWEIIARHDTTEVSSSTALIGTGHVVAGAVSDVFGIEPVEATIGFLAASAPGPVDVKQATVDYRAMLEASLPHGWEIRGGSVVRVLEDADRLDPHAVAYRAWPGIDSFTITEYTN